jgi:hypothetical protein
MKRNSTKRVTRVRAKKPSATTAANLSEKFERGEDVLDYFDTENPILEGQGIERVEIDFPGWIVAGLEQEASRVGVTRDALLKIWVAQRLDDRGAGNAVTR